MLVPIDLAKKYKKLNLTEEEIEYLNSEIDSISSANED